MEVNLKVQDYSNRAYDFEMFESNNAKKLAQVVELPSLVSRKKAKYVRKLKIWSIGFSVFLTIGVGVGGVLFSRAKLAEYAYCKSESLKKLEESKNKNEQLQIKLASENSQADQVSEDISKDAYVEILAISTGDKSKIK